MANSPAHELSSSSHGHSDSALSSVCSVLSRTQPHTATDTHDDSCSPLDDGSSLEIISDTSDTSWTDGKHSSYLNFIEATFIRNLYHREYCALDLCGRAPYENLEEPNSAESQLISSACSRPTSLEKRDWQSKSSSKPLMSPDNAWVVLKNSWPQTCCVHVKDRSTSTYHVSEAEEGKEVESQKNVVLPPVIKLPSSEHTYEMQLQGMENQQSASSTQPGSEDKMDQLPIIAKMDGDLEAEILNQKAEQLVGHKESQTRSLGIRKRGSQTTSEHRSSGRQKAIDDWSDDGCAPHEIDQVY